MKHIKKFETFLKESSITADPATKPIVKPPLTKPERPTKPGKPITRPSVDPKPKAKKTTESDVAKKFISEVNKKGESVKKYLRK
jgi:hypothetical protein